MSVRISIANQRVMAWCGLACTAIFLFGFVVLAEFIPPPSPEASVEETVAFFTENSELKRLGLWLNTFAGTLCGIWVVAIAIQLKRTEGRLASMAWINVMMGALLAFEFILPVMIWQACLYRPELDPEWAYRMNDLAWLCFVGIVATAVAQAIAIAVAILEDRRDDPVFPRWVGYFNIWCALLFCPGGLVVFFKDGPFAWNGVIAFWLVLIAFSLWLVVMSVVLLRHAIPHQEREEAAAVQSAGAIAEAVPE